MNIGEVPAGISTVLYASRIQKQEVALNNFTILGTVPTYRYRDNFSLKSQMIFWKSIDKIEVLHLFFYCDLTNFDDLFLKNLAQLNETVSKYRYAVIF